MRIVRFLTLGGLVAIVGCASTSDVVPVGNGVYQVSATSRGVLGGAGGEGTEALKAANTYCADQGKKMVAQASDSQGPGLNPGVGIAITATVRFTCE